MRRFKQGDLAVTVKSRMPLLNDGHVVRILRVAGPVPDRGVEFGYCIERIDGQRFVFVRSPSGDPTPSRTHQVLVPHWQLRPILKKGPGASARRSRRRVPETS